MGPDRHVGMRLSACSTKRRIPGFASGMWPHTVSMRPHARRDAWNFPQGSRTRRDPKSMAVTRRLSFYIVNYSHAPFFELGPQNEKHVTVPRRFFFQIVVGEL